MEGKCVSGHVENILLDTTDKTHSQSKSELERHHKKCLQKYKDGQFHIIFIQHFDGFWSFATKIIKPDRFVRADQLFGPWIPAEWGLSTRER